MDESISEEDDKMVRNIQHKLDEIYEDNRCALIRDIDQITMSSFDKYNRSRSQSWNVGRWDSHDRYGQYNHYHNHTQLPRFGLPPTPNREFSASQSLTSNTTMSTNNEIAEPVVSLGRAEARRMQKPVLGSAWGGLLESVSQRVGWPSVLSKEPSIPESYSEEIGPSH